MHCIKKMQHVIDSTLKVISYTCVVMYVIKMRWYSGFLSPSVPPEKPPMPPTVMQVKNIYYTFDYFLAKTTKHCKSDENMRFEDWIKCYIITVHLPFVVGAADSWAGPVRWPGVHGRHGDGEAGGAAEEWRQHAVGLRVPQRCQSRTSFHIELNKTVLLEAGLSLSSDIRLSPLLLDTIVYINAHHVSHSSLKIL